MFQTLTLKNISFNWIKNLVGKVNSNVIHDCRLVILVNNNLPMTKGKIAASCSHAAVLSYIEANKRAPAVARHWLSVGQKKIVLKWDRGESELQNIASSAAKENLVSVIVRDAGRTQVKPGSVTAVGIGPGSAEEINKLLPKNLKLL